MMSADAVLHWSEVAVDAAFAPGPASPAPFFRNLAIVHVAMYDAVNAIDRSHDPYFANVHASSGASMEAAAAQACARYAFGADIRANRRHLTRP